ncbi:MAG: BatD family protein [Thermaurantimonas sp.]
MKKIGKYSLILFLFSIFINISLCHAQDLQFISKASKYKVSRFDEIELTFTINGQGTNFKEPKNLREHFTVISGPNSRTFTKFDGSGLYIENSVSYVVMPKKAGNFTIDEAYITVSGKTYKSKPIHIEVSSNILEENNDPNDPKNIAKKLAFVRVRVSKNTFFIGEGFTVDYLLFYKTNVMNIEILNEPSFTGFYAEVIKEDIPPFQEQVDGESFNVVTLKRYIVFGQKVGTFKPGSLEVRIPTEISSPQRDFFNPFFRPSTVVNQVSVFHMPTITVNALPDYKGKYEFSGAVGSYTFNAKLTKTEVNAGDAVSLHLTVEGTGNIKMFTLPKLEFPVQFDVFEPKSSDKYSVTKKGMSGSKSLEYILIPKYNGTYKLPTAAFVYFDPSASRYIEKVYEDLKITVSGGQAYTAPKNESDYDRSKASVPATYVNRDILFIKTNAKWILPSVFYKNSFLQTVWIATALLIFSLVFFYSRFLKQILLAYHKKFTYKKSIQNLLQSVEQSTDNTKEKLRFLNRHFRSILNEYFGVENINAGDIHPALKDTPIHSHSGEIASLIREAENAVFSFKTDEELSELLQRYKNLLLLISK